MLGTTDYYILVAVFSHARIIQPPVNILWCSWHIVYFLLSLWSKLWLEISLASISETLESSSRDYYTSTHWFIVVIMLVHSVFGFMDSVLLDGFFFGRDLYELGNISLPLGHAQTWILLHRLTHMRGNSVFADFTQS